MRLLRTLSSLWLLSGKLERDRSVFRALPAHIPSIHEPSIRFSAPTEKTGRTIQEAIEHWRYRQRASDFSVSELSLDGSVAMISEPTSSTSSWKVDDQMSVSDPFNSQPISRIKKFLKSRYLRLGAIDQALYQALKFAISDENDEDGDYTNQSRLIIDIKNFETVDQTTEFHKKLSKLAGDLVTSYTLKSSNQIQISRLQNGTTESTIPPEKKLKQPDFLHFVVMKCKMNTVDVVHLFSKQLKCSESRFRFFGNKDNMAVTNQIMSFYRAPGSFISMLNRAVSRMRNLGYLINVGNFTTSHTPASLGRIVGNRFRIVLRKLSQDSKLKLNKKLHTRKMLGLGHVNYYGIQRFGGHKGKRSRNQIVTVEVGMSLLRARYDHVVELLLSSIIDSACNGFFVNHDEEGFVEWSSNSGNKQTMKEGSHNLAAKKMIYQYRFCGEIFASSNPTRRFDKDAKNIQSNSDIDSTTTTTTTTSKHWADNQLNKCVTNLRGKKLDRLANQEVLKSVILYGKKLTKIDLSQRILLEGLELYGYGECEKIVNRLPLPMLKLFLHSVQSCIWNHLASKRYLRLLEDIQLDNEQEKVAKLSLGEEIVTPEMTTTASSSIENKGSSSKFIKKMASFPKLLFNKMVQGETDSNMRNEEKQDSIESAGEAVKDTLFDQVKKRGDEYFVSSRSGTDQKFEVRETHSHNNNSSNKINEIKSIVDSLNHQFCKEGDIVLLKQDELETSKGPPTASVGSDISDFGIQDLNINRTAIEVWDVLYSKYNRRITPYLVTKSDELLKRFPLNCMCIPIIGRKSILSDWMKKELETMDIHANSILSSLQSNHNITHLTLHGSYRHFIVTPRRIELMSLEEHMSTLGLHLLPNISGLQDDPKSKVEKILARSEKLEVGEDEIDEEKEVIEELDDVDDKEEGEELDGEDEESYTSSSRIGLIEQKLSRQNNPSSSSSSSSSPTCNSDQSSILQQRRSIFITNEDDEPEDIEDCSVLCFDLPSGSYATEFLRSLESDYGE